VQWPPGDAVWRGTLGLPLANLPVGGTIRAQDPGISELFGAAVQAGTIRIASAHSELPPVSEKKFARVSITRSLVRL